MKKYLFVFGLLCMLSVNVFAQNEWVQQYKTAQQAYANDQLEVAALSAKKCLKNYLLQSGEISKNYQSILRLLTTISYEQGAYQEGASAIPILRKAVRN